MTEVDEKTKEEILEAMQRLGLDDFLLFGCRYDLENPDRILTQWARSLNVEALEVTIKETLKDNPLMVPWLLKIIAEVIEDIQPPIMH